MDRLTANVRRFFKVSPTDVRSSGKQHHLQLVKAMICYCVVQKLKTKVTDNAHYLNLSKSAVSKIVTGYKADECYNKFVETHI